MRSFRKDGLDIIKNSVFPVPDEGAYLLFTRKYIDHLNSKSKSKEHLACQLFGFLKQSPKSKASQ